MGKVERIDTAEGPTRHRISVDEYLLLADAGAFGGDRTELVEGEIFVLSPLWRPHAALLADIVTDLSVQLRERDDGLRVYSPPSTQVDAFNLPQPDVVVAYPEELKWVSADSVRLVVEISSSTLRYDLDVKAPLYARAGIPEYWIVDVAGCRVIRLHAPSVDGYAERSEIAFGTLLVSATLADIAIATTRW